MGFSVPLKHWLRDDLYGYTREILLDPRRVSAAATSRRESSNA